MSTVLEFFDEASIPSMPLDDDTVIARIEGEHGTWRCVATTDDDAETFVCAALLDVEVPTARRTEVIELLMRATAGLVIGNFEWDLEDGPVMFRTGIDVGGGALTAALVANVVVANVVITDRYLPAIEAVVEGTASAVEALAAIEG